MHQRLRGSLTIFSNTVVLGLAVAFIVACSASQAAEPKHTKDSLEKVKKLVDSKKAVLIDVREQREWDAGHVDGAILLPLSTLNNVDGDSEFVEALRKKLPKKYPLYVHCRSGGRCLLASEILEEIGYETRPLKPGYQQLIDAGFPRAETKASE